MRAVVVGSGPNGLVAAALLARAGLDVVVLERHPTRAGGAVGSEAATLPGFVHDVGAAFFPFALASPAFAELGLEAHGLRWRHAPIDSAHPDPSGDCAFIARDLELSVEGFRADGEAWRRLAEWHRRVEPALPRLLLGPLPPSPSTLLRLGLGGLLGFARIALASGRGLSERLFRTSAARRVLPGLALHVDLGPDDRFSGALGYMLASLAQSGGFPVPEGAGRLADALVGAVEVAGGAVRLGAEAVRLRTEGGRAVAVECADGTALEVDGPVLADTDAAALYLRLLDGHPVPGRLQRRMRSFPRGWGTFKVDWALSRLPPWTAEPARRAAVVHAGDSLDDLSAFTREVRAGRLPSNPYLVIGQQSLADPTRAPDGDHTLWAYSRVPSRPEGGWAAHAERFADAIEARIEGLAPGFRARIRARRIVTPVDLEAMDPNLVGGDLGGGSNQWTNQLVFRPAFPWFRYRTPVRNVYLCSSYAHPGAGVHGMCGFNAARVALREIGIR